MKLPILVILACLAVPTLATAQYGQSNDDGVPKISVSGEALVRVTPDKVTVHLGIETWNLNIHTAKKENNDILAATIDAIKKTGVKEKNVQTDRLSIHPRYKNEHTKESFIGYFVQNSITVVLKDPSKVEDLITAVLVAGVTHIHGINFETTEFKKHREEARRLAVDAAREKAEKMAAVLDKEIGEPLTINETSRYGRSFSYFGNGWGWGRNQAMSQNVVQNAGGESNDISDTLALGKISIRGSVNIVFELK
jgi:uncharacterized protein YggE